jgi:hypothetical protein
MGIDTTLLLRFAMIQTEPAMTRKTITIANPLRLRLDPTGLEPGMRLETEPPQK